MTLGLWRGAAALRLAQSGDPDADVDVQWMLCEATGLSRSALRWHQETALTDDQLARLNAWLDARASGEPLQYILGTAAFYGRLFRCDRRALIPRPETETLVETALGLMRPYAAPRVLDLCCGTGAIGLTVALEKTDCVVTLADLSGEALALAKENATLLGAQAAFCQGDLFAPLAGERFDFILCNPPYLTADDMACLQREVRFEPAMALDGGRDGLAFYRRIAAEAGEHLNRGGFLLLEIGQGQAGDVRALLDDAFTDITVTRDLEGVDRVVCARHV